MTTTDVITAINAYADAQRAEVSERAWLARVHRSSTGPKADAARARRDAGRDALDLIQDWPTVQTLTGGARILEAPDGVKVLYYCERADGRTFERLTTDV